jgi:micrococcal nuclease
MKAVITRVLDGDTVEATIKIRMARIDTPETKGVEKPLGLVSKTFTTSKLNGKEVQLAVLGTDYYDRVLAEIYLDGANFNDLLVKEGKAEMYSPANHNNGKVD